MKRKIIGNRYQKSDQQAGNEGKGTNACRELLSSRKGIQEGFHEDRYQQSFLLLEGVLKPHAWHYGNWQAEGKKF